MLKKFNIFFFIALLIIVLTSCTNINSDVFNTSDDILTQTVISPDKIPITILVKYAFSINAFEKAVEDKFPELDIIQVGNYTSNMGVNEYESRLKNDDLTDIVMTWPLNTGEEYFDDRLIELSSLPLTSKYTISMLNNISKDGKLYYLPGPSQVRALVYNKTLFEENGWKVPKDFEGFITLCKEIEKSGIRSLQLGLGNSEVLDTAFVGYGYAESFSKPESAQRIENYNNGVGSFADNFTPALNTFQKLIDEGILKKDDLNIYYPDRERMLFTRQCAMTEDSVLITRMGLDYNGCKDEFALMPFFNPGSGADWSRLYPVCFIGVNKHLTESKNKEKYDLVMKILEYISTPEGQTALAGDTGAMFSSLNGTKLPDIPEIKDLVPSLLQGRYAVFPTLKNAQSALRTGLAGMVSGTMTSQDVVKIVDEQNASPPVKESAVVLGSAKESFSLIETGNFITDTMRLQCDSDIALFLDNGKDGKYNGKGVSARIYKGDLTSIDIMRIMPDLKLNEKGELWKVTMTGADLIKTLEYAISVYNNREGWFYYFSGLRMEYAPAAKPGERIRRITDTDGKDIDLSKLYTIAVMDESVPNEYIESCEKTGELISHILEKAIQKNKVIEPSNDGRFTIVEP